MSANSLLSSDILKGRSDEEDKVVYPKVNGICIIV